MKLVCLLVLALAAAAAVLLWRLCRYGRRMLAERIDSGAVKRFRHYLERYNEASRTAMETALDVRHLTQEELKLVAGSAYCVLWHAAVEDRGEPHLHWDLRAHSEEADDFTPIHDTPPDWRVGAWYHGRREEDMFRLAEQATAAIRGGAPGYRQEFLCKSKDGGDVWFQEDVRIEPAGEKKWQLFGVSMDITERKRAEEQREKLLKELQEALAQVKQLRGMLPICSACKKVRNDAGYWDQIENYVRSHSEVEFSHGICPECYRKLYADEWSQRPEIRGQSSEVRGQQQWEREAH